MDKEKLYTLVGRFLYDENKFKTIDNQLIECLAYRHLSREMSTHLVAVNVQYISGYVNNWVIFQCVILD